jgi:Flp pilus assembly protein TadG
MADTSDCLCGDAFGGELMRHKERGTQLIEFAVVLPVIMLLALIVAEGANMFRVYELVANAAREGARLSSLYQYSYTAQGLKSATDTCTFNSTNTTSGDTVCQGVANYAQDNGLIGASLQQCGTFTVSLNQAYTAPGDNTARYSRVSAVCTYQLRWLPKLPFYSTVSSVSITGTTAFLNFW